jgi:hypothetical protein
MAYPSNVPGTITTPSSVAFWEHVGTNAVATVVFFLAVAFTLRRVISSFFVARLEELRTTTALAHNNSELIARTQTQIIDTNEQLARTNVTVERLAEQLGHYADDQRQLMMRLIDAAAPVIRKAAPRKGA